LQCDKTFKKQLRESKKEMCTAAQAQYTRRGKPAEVTGWGPSDIHKYMRWQFNEVNCGRLSKKNLGGLAWKLPRKSESGEPAPLPDEVIAFVSDSKTPPKKKKKVAKSSSASSCQSSSSDNKARSKNTEKEKKGSRYEIDS